MDAGHEIRPYVHNARYYETDQMGIIHHSNYIRWMEEARIDLMDQYGISYAAMEADGIVSPVVSVECSYKRMVRFGDDVEITIRVMRYNGARLDLAYEMTDKKTGEVCTTAGSTHGFMDRSGKLLSLKKASPELHRLFQEMLEGSRTDDGTQIR